MAELIVKLKGREISRFPILRVKTKIGRDETMDVVIDNVGVSRHHASVEYDGRGFIVRDEGSQNGIFVNGNRSSQAAVTEGDVIGIGKFSLVFSSAGGVPLNKLMRDSPLVGWSSDPDPEDNNPLETMALTNDELARVVGALDAARAATGPRARRQFGAPSVQVGMQLDERPRPSGRPSPTRQAESERLRKRRREAKVLLVVNVILGTAVLGMVGLMLYLLATGN